MDSSLDDADSPSAKDEPSASREAVLGDYMAEETPLEDSTADETPLGNSADDYDATDELCVSGRAMRSSQVVDSGSAS